MIRYASRSSSSVRQSLIIVVVIFLHNDIQQRLHWRNPDPFESQIISPFPKLTSSEWCIRREARLVHPYRQRREPHLLMMTIMMMMKKKTAACVVVKMRTGRRSKPSFSLYLFTILNDREHGWKRYRVADNAAAKRRRRRRRWQRKGCKKKKSSSSRHGIIPLPCLGPRRLFVLVWSSSLEAFHCQ